MLDILCSRCVAEQSALSPVQSGCCLCVHHMTLTQCPLTLVLCFVFFCCVAGRVCVIQRISTVDPCVQVAACKAKGGVAAIITNTVDSVSFLNNFLVLYSVHPLHCLLAVAVRGLFLYRLHGDETLTNKRSFWLKRLRERP